jgi:hypothetical protein
MTPAPGAEDLDAAAIARAYDFSGDVKVIVVGGGAGPLLATLLRTHRRLTGILFDRPQVITGAERVFKDVGVIERAAWAGGDFFCALPGGADIYLLKSVLHNWNDDEAVRLLGCCRRAMAEGARLLIAERIGRSVPTRNRRSGAGTRRVNGNGQVPEQSEQDYRALFDAAGFAWSRTIPTGSPLSLIEAIAIRSSSNP